MKVVSAAGEFELSMERIEVRPGAVVLIGKMGLWEAETFIDAADMGRMLRLLSRPRVVLWILAQPFVALARRLRRRRGSEPS